MRILKALVFAVVLTVIGYAIAGGEEQVVGVYCGVQREAVDVAGLDWRDHDGARFCREYCSLPAC